MLKYTILVSASCFQSEHIVLGTSTTHAPFKIMKMCLAALLYSLDAICQLLLLLEPLASCAFRRAYSHSVMPETFLNLATLVMVETFFRAEAFRDTFRRNAALVNRVLKRPDTTCFPMHHVSF